MRPSLYLLRFEELGNTTDSLFHSHAPRTPAQRPVLASCRACVSGGSQGELPSCSKLDHREGEMQERKDRNLRWPCSCPHPRTQLGKIRDVRAGG